MRWCLLFSHLLIVSTLFISSHSALSQSNSNHLSTQAFAKPASETSIQATLPALLKPKVITKALFNNKWFTQGLYQDGNNFYISSGLYSQSTLIYQQAHKVTRYSLPPHFFAEGLTVVGDKIFLLTWKEETLFIFDKKTLRPIKKLRYKGEGWGLTHDTDSLIMSNGSNTLYFRDKDSFEIKRTITIKGLDKINELEYVDGIIWANRWLEDTVYGIDATNGCIVARIDLRELRTQSISSTINTENVTNGIAYDKNKNGLWVTGKLWNQRFLIALPKLNKTHCSAS